MTPLRVQDYMTTRHIDNDRTAYKLGKYNETVHRHQRTNIPNVITLLKIIIEIIIEPHHLKVVEINLL